MIGSIIARTTLIPVLWFLEALRPSQSLARGPAPRPGRRPRGAWAGTPWGGACRSSAAASPSRSTVTSSLWITLKVAPPISRDSLPALTSTTLLEISYRKHGCHRTPMFTEQRNVQRLGTNQRNFSAPITGSFGYSWHVVDGDRILYPCSMRMILAILHYASVLVYEQYTCVSHIRVRQRRSPWLVSVAVVQR